MHGIIWLKQNDKKGPQKLWESILGDSPGQRKATLMGLLPKLLITWSNKQNDRPDQKKKHQQKNPHYTQRQILGHLDVTDLGHILSRYKHLAPNSSILKGIVYFTLVFWCSYIKHKKKCLKMSALFMQCYGVIFFCIFYFI